MDFAMCRFTALGYHPRGLDKQLIELPSVNAKASGDGQDDAELRSECEASRNGFCLEVLFTKFRIATPCPERYPDVNTAGLSICPA
jgi:hypothetical protein